MLKPLALVTISALLLCSSSANEFETDLKAALASSSQYQLKVGAVDNAHLDSSKNIYYKRQQTRAKAGSRGSDAVCLPANNKKTKEFRISHDAKRVTPDSQGRGNRASNRRPNPNLSTPSVEIQPRHRRWGNPIPHRLPSEEKEYVDGTGLVLGKYISQPKASSAQKPTRNPRGPKPNRRQRRAPPKPKPTTSTRELTGIDSPFVVDDNPEIRIRPELQRHNDPSVPCAKCVQYARAKPILEKLSNLVQQRVQQEKEEEEAKRHALPDSRRRHKDKSKRSWEALGPHHQGAIFQASPTSDDFVKSSEVNDETENDKPHQDYPEKAQKSNLQAGQVSTRVTRGSLPPESKPLDPFAQPATERKIQAFRPTYQQHQPAQSTTDGVDVVRSTVQNIKRYFPGYRRERVAKRTHELVSREDDRPPLYLKVQSFDRRVHNKLIQLDHGELVVGKSQPALFATYPFRRGLSLIPYNQEDIKNLNITYLIRNPTDRLKFEVAVFKNETMIGLRKEKFSRFILSDILHNGWRVPPPGSPPKELVEFFVPDEIIGERPKYGHFQWIFTTRPDSPDIFRLSWRSESSPDEPNTIRARLIPRYAIRKNSDDALSAHNHTSNEQDFIPPPEVDEQENYNPGPISPPEMHSLDIYTEPH